MHCHCIILFAPHIGGLKLHAYSCGRMSERPNVQQGRLQHTVAILAQGCCNIPCTNVAIRTNMSKKDQPSSKRLKVAELGRGHYISLSAKAALLQDLKDLKYIPEDVACSRFSLAAARKEAANRQTRFGKCIISREFNTEGGTVSYPVQNPLAMLYIAMGESDRYSAYTRDAIHRHGVPSPESPWLILFYVDEVTCGNPLAVRKDAKRKVQGVYWSLYQLGSMALSDETCWFELVAFRTSETSEFVGTISHLLDVCLTCFFDPSGHDIRHGLSFEVKGYGKMMLCLAVGHLIADIKAIVEAIGALGVHAIMPCFFCRRVLSFKAKAKPELQALPDFVDLGCLDHTRWGKHTDASLLKLLSDLRTAAATLPAKELAKKQTLCGYKHIVGNFLLNRHTIRRPLRLICLDWMHLVFQTGDFNRECFRVLVIGTTRTCHAYDLLKAYFEAFTFPKAFSIRTNLLNSGHWDACKDAQSFKCNASEGLTLYPVVCKFFQDVLLPRHEGTAIHATLSAMVVSFVSLCDVVDVLQLCKHGRQVEPDLLQEKMDLWATSHRAAYGTSLMYLKTHLTYHLVDILRARKEDSDDTLLIACWVLDRDRNVACVCVCTNICTTCLA